MRTRSALTLVELLVVLACVGVLVSLIAAALLSARGAARKMTCSNNMRQLGLALQNYESAHRAFPRGNGSGFSYLVRLLPYLEESQRYAKVDFRTRALDQLDKEWTQTPTVLRCPADALASQASNRHSTNYIGISGGGASADNNGIIYGGSISRGRAVRTSDVVDGLSNTLAITEAAAYVKYSDGSTDAYSSASTVTLPRKFSMPEEVNLFREQCFSIDSRGAEMFDGLGSTWIQASIGITRINCIFPKQPHNCANKSGLTNALFAPSSFHSGGVYGALADGSVRLFSQELDEQTWQALGTRNGSEVATVVQ